MNESMFISPLPKEHKMEILKFQIKLSQSTMVQPLSGTTLQQVIQNTFVPQPSGTSLQQMMPNALVPQLSGTTLQQCSGNYTWNQSL